MRKEWSQDALGGGLGVRPFTDEEYKKGEDYACVSIDCRDRPSHRATVKLRNFWRERDLCSYHALKFAKRHKLDFIPRNPS